MIGLFFLPPPLPLPPPLAIGFLYTYMCISLSLSLSLSFVWALEAIHIEWIRDLPQKRGHEPVESPDFDPCRERDKPKGSTPNGSFHPKPPRPSGKGALMGLNLLRCTRGINFILGFSGNSQQAWKCTGAPLRRHFSGERSLPSHVFREDLMGAKFPQTWWIGHTSRNPPPKRRLATPFRISGGEVPGGRRQSDIRQG